MKLSELNIHGALYTLGQISQIEKEDFVSFIYVMEMLKDINEEDADVPKEFSWVKNALRNEKKFIECCDELSEKGYCDSLGNGRYCFTKAGAHILEKWANLNINTGWPVYSAVCPLSLD